jgi:glycosyltransferase involved in cell wall biosynthesis
LPEVDFLVESPLNSSSVDLVIGIPSYNEADNIGLVVRQVAEGLNKYFPDLNTAIINADNSSEDGTKEVFLQADSGEIPKVYLSTPPGVKGKGNNFKNLFNYLLRYRPKAVIVLDADLRSIRPEWVRSFGRTVFKGFDFVTPLYSRNEYDGTITNHLCYPLLYSVMGRNIRQPIGGDFAFSGRLLEHWIRQNWGESILQYGVDIFMTSEALLSGFSVAQVTLGSKIHKPSAPKLGEMFTQVVDTLFRQLSVSSWKRNMKRPQAPPVIAYNKRLVEAPQSLSIDYKALKERAGKEFSAHEALVLEILSKKLGSEIEAMFQRGILRISAAAWAEIVFSFLAAYAAQSDRDLQLRIVEALKPLYFARTVSFIWETLELDHVESEKRLVQQAETFWNYRREWPESHPAVA